MTTRATDAKARRRSRAIVSDETIAGVRYQQTSGGTGIALGAEGGGGGFRPDLPPLASSGEARFSLASDTADKGSKGESLKDAAADVWSKHQKAILIGAAALVLIAIVRKR